MFQNKESYFYLLLGIILLILTFTPVEFLDKPIGSDGYLLNIRVLILMFGIFFVIFPPSEPVRITSLGSWILNLINSIKGNHTNHDYFSDEPEPKRKGKFRYDKQDSKWKKGYKNIEKNKDSYPDQPSFEE